MNVPFIVRLLLLVLRTVLNTKPSQAQMPLLQRRAASMQQVRHDVPGSSFSSDLAFDRNIISESINGGASAISALKMRNLGGFAYE